MKTSLVLLFIFCIYNNIYPCSIIAYRKGPEVFFCGNEDWSLKDPAIFTIPKADTEYGVVLLGWGSYLPFYPQAGINSEGLCFDWAAVPAQRYEPIPGKKDLDVNSTIEILKKCKTVEEAVRYTRSFNFSHLAEEHIMFTDRTGKACVIEYTKGSRKEIWNNEKPLFITNFNLTDKESGWYPCKRYQTIENRMSKNDLNEDDLVKLLEAVHQEGANPTIYSYVINVTKGTIKIFYNHDFQKCNEYSINKLIKKDQKFRIE